MDLDKVDVVDFLTALGIRQITDDGEEVQYSCPFPYHGNGDATPSAYMNKRSTAFFCHGCKAKGNAIHFLAQLEVITPLLAARFIKERYDQGFIDPTTHGGFGRELEALIIGKDKPEPHVNKPIEYELEPLSEDAKNYLESRGFDCALLSTFGVGLCPTTGRIAIPVRNEQGQLVGFKGRSFPHAGLPGSKPKYLVLGDKQSAQTHRYGFPTYEKSHVVFGLDQYRHTVPTVLCEGEFNAIALSHMGDFNVLATSGSVLSERQRDLLVKTLESITIFFDDDEAGYRGTAQVVEALEPYMPVRVVGTHEMDPADYLAAGLSDECVKLIDEAKSTTELWLASS